jgi:hypothetical protein
MHNTVYLHAFSLHVFFFFLSLTRSKRIPVDLRGFIALRRSVLVHLTYMNSLDVLILLMKKFSETFKIPFASYYKVCSCVDQII